MIRRNDMTAPIDQKQLELKPLNQQTIVITGASSGIGLATARMAAAKGARVVLAARSGHELGELEREIEEAGGEATHIVADVANPKDMNAIADHAIATFGGFDTWVNNAAVHIFGLLTEVTMADHQRLFEVNFWGQVHGSLVAVRHLRDRGGALINVGSITGEQALPLMGMYSASKHAIHGFTNALRMELEHEGVPISITLVEPASIDTPFIEHSRNYLEHEPKNPPPSYPPETVAEAILHAACHPQRELVVGGAGWLITRASRIAPRLTEKWVERRMLPQELQDTSPARPREGTLYNPSQALKERGSYPGYRTSGSVFTKAEMHPVISLAAGAACVGAIIGLTAMLMRGRNVSQRRRQRELDYIPPLWQYPPRAAGPMIGVP